ncbi:MAG: glycosyl transferase [Bacteroidaceae bacterium]|nr:glycosyl transferase [Bacteroidaceae bacterium]
MIPKIIHYCWFGRGELSLLALKCIASWRKFLPDYEIKEWNEDNFDVNIIPYTAEAYAAKKYAFVSDYARFWILYNYGGVYFDTDVEVIKPMDDILAAGAFMGCEQDSPITVAPGLGIAAVAGMSLYKRLLDYYEPLHFDPDHITITIVGHTTRVLQEYGLTGVEGPQRVADCTIYPAEFFNPIHIITKRLKITPHTRSIHWYAATWNDHKENPIKTALRKCIPERILLLWNKR